MCRILINSFAPRHFPFHHIRFYLWQSKKRRWFCLGGCRLNAPANGGMFSCHNDCFRHASRADYREVLSAGTTSGLVSVKGYIFYLTVVRECFAGGFGIRSTSSSVDPCLAFFSRLYKRPAVMMGSSPMNGRPSAQAVSLPLKIYSPSDANVASRVRIFFVSSR